MPIDERDLNELRIAVNQLTQQIEKMIEEMERLKKAINNNTDALER